MRTTFLLLVLLCLAAAPASATWGASPNLSTCLWSSGSSVSCTVTALTAGNVLFLVWETTTLNGDISGTPSGCGTWAAQDKQSIVNSAKRIQVFHATALTASCTAITLTLVGTPVVGRGRFYEFSVTSFSALDATGSGGQASSASAAITTASITPTASRSTLILAGWSSSGTFSSYGAGTGTGCTEVGDSSPPNGGNRSAYCIVTSTSGAYSMSLSTTSSGQSEGDIIVSYVETAAAAGTKMLHIVTQGGY